MSGKRWDRKPVVATMGEFDGKAPPHDLELERAVLACALTDPDSGAEELVAIVKPEDFYSEAHRRVWEAVTDLVSEGKMPDFIHVQAWLRARERLGVVNGGQYLTEIASSACTPTLVAEYAMLVAGKSRQRAMMVALHRSIAEAYAGDLAPSEYLSQTIARVEAAGRLEDSDTKPMWMDDVVKAELASFRKNTNEVALAKTGLADVDAKLFMRAGDLVILAARPGMGKTSLAVQAAIATGNALVVSLEMPQGQLGRRSMSNGIGMDFVRAVGQANDAVVVGKVAEAFKAVRGANVMIVDKPSLSVAEVRAFARHTARELEKRGKGPLRCVVIDYLQLMRDPETRSRNGNREQEISEISQGLKALAKQLGIVVIALSQLNRAVESRSDKRPLMSDLRESGAIEQDADKIVFIYRENYYAKKDLGPIEPVEIIVSKQRQGAIGMVPVAWEGQTTTFHDAKSDDYTEGAY